MIARYEYPCRIEASVGGGLIVRFADMPEAIGIAETFAELESRAAGALIAALNSCIKAGARLPIPSLADENQSTVTPPPLAAAKLGLYETILDCGMTKADLAQRLGRDATFVDRLLDLENRCDIQQIDQTLAVLGRRVVVTVQAAA